MNIWGAPMLIKGAGEKLVPRTFPNGRVKFLGARLKRI